MADHPGASRPAPSVAEILRATGAVRRFLPEPVSDEVLMRVMDGARFAPSGGNRQPWRVVIVKDAGLRHAIGDLYIESFREYVAMTEAGLTPWGFVTDEEAEQRAIEAAQGVEDTNFPGLWTFARHFHEVPVMLMVLADLVRLGAPDKVLSRQRLVSGSSIYPFAWSILLAAHSEGLGGLLTTMVCGRETRLRELLGFPETVAAAALLALGYPQRRATRLSRRELHEFVTVDAHDGAALGT